MNAEVKRAISVLQDHGMKYLVVEPRFYCGMVRYLQECNQNFLPDLQPGMRLVPMGATDDEIVLRRLGDTLVFRGKRLMLLEEEVTVSETLYGLQGSDD